MKKEANSNHKYQATDPWRKVVLENALDAVVAINADNVIIDWNQQAENIFGWKKEEVIGKSLSDIMIPPNFRLPHKKGMEHFLATGEGPVLNRRIEVTALNRQGVVFPVELTVVPINIEGSYVFYSFLRDISNLKLAEKARKDFQGQIELLSNITKVLLADPLSLENRVHQFVKMLTPALADWAVVDILDKNGEMKMLAASHVDPLKLEEIKQMRIKFPPSQKTRVGIFNVMQTGKFELVPLIPEQALREISINTEHFEMMKKLNIKSYICVPIEAHGQILGTLTLVSDESRTYQPADLQLSQELAHRAAFAVHNASLYKDAQEAVVARDEFLSIASHELKTPITSMKLNSQLFERKLNKSPDHIAEPKQIEHLLDVYNRNVERMSKLIEDMLDITRISTGKFKLDLEPLEISTLIQETVRQLEIEIASSGIKLEMILPAESLCSNCDRFRIEQVFSNLITNVIKYAPKGKLTISLSSQSSTLLMTFKDEGTGIDPNNLDRIFSRFERAISANVSGLGLGLYICRQIVEAHRGKIWAESTPGIGSTFYVELPRA